MKRRMCSICGAEYGACEHVKGETYGAERCAAVLCEAVDAYEFSVWWQCRHRSRRAFCRSRRAAAYRWTSLR